MANIGNGGTKVTMTWGEAIRAIAVILAIAAVGYRQELRIERLTNEVSGLRDTLTVMERRFDRQQQDIEDWKRATTGLFFRPQKVGR